MTTIYFIMSLLSFAIQRPYIILAYTVNHDIPHQRNVKNATKRILDKRLKTVYAYYNIWERSQNES
jgi:hypothetical protein